MMKGRDCGMVRSTMGNSAVQDHECCNVDLCRTINNYIHIEKSNRTSEVEILKAK